MNRTLLGIAGLSAAAICAPATAQYTGGGYQGQSGSSQDQPGSYPDRSYQDQAGGNGGRGGNISARIEQMQARLQSGVQSGAISRSEAVPLRQQLRQLTQMERQYSRDGLTQQERGDLQQRLRSLRQQVRQADGGGQGRYDQYDRDDYGQAGSDRQYDREGRAYDGADDRAPEPVQQRGGLGGILGNVLGGGGLRVGQRASADLGGVPYEVRDRYRDGNGVYYRSDGRSVYQIDARTQTVVRVDPINR